MNPSPPVFAFLPHPVRTSLPAHGVKCQDEDMAVMFLRGALWMSYCSFPAGRPPTVRVLGLFWWIQTSKRWKVVWKLIKKSVEQTSYTHYNAVEYWNPEFTFGVWSFVVVIWWHQHLTWRSVRHAPAPSWEYQTVLSALLWSAQFESGLNHADHNQLNDECVCRCIACPALWSWKNARRRPHRPPHRTLQY